MSYISTEEAREMCNENYKYFETHLDELCKRYNNKYIVLKDCNVIGAYDSFDEAYDKTVEKEDLGTFLIQLCSKDESLTTSSFYSNNVVFA